MKENVRRRSWLLVMLAVVLAMALPCLAGAAKVRITLNKAKATIYTSGSKTVTLKATVTGSKNKVKWSSKNKAIATVNQNGKVTAKKAGTTKITAKVNGKSATCIITVIKPTIKLNKSKATIYTSGTKTVQLKATVKGKSKTVKWSSGNKAVATVSSGGKVTAKKAGTATITAKANGVTAKCTITVKKKTANVKQVKLNTSFAGGNEKYFIKGLTKDGKNVWSFTTGNWYPSMQVSNIAYDVYEKKGYVYVLEDRYFYKLDKQTGKVLTKKYINLTGSCNTYVDESNGILYAVPFLGDDIVYAISSNGVLQKSIPFNSYGNGGASIKGKSGNYLEVFLEFGERTVYVPIN